MSKKKSAPAVPPEWEQDFVWRIASQVEIPLNNDGYPNPKTWKQVPKAVKKTKDYYPLRADWGRCIHYLSPSTQTWYQVPVDPNK